MNQEQLRASWRDYQRKHRKDQGQTNFYLKVNGAEVDLLWSALNLDITRIEAEMPQYEGELKQEQTELLEQLKKLRDKVEEKFD